MNFQELQKLGLMMSIDDGFQVTEFFEELLGESFNDLQHDPEFRNRCRQVYHHPANELLKYLFPEDSTRFDNDFIISALSIRVLEKIGAYEPELAMTICLLLKYEQGRGNFVLELKQEVKA